MKKLVSMLAALIITTISYSQTMLPSDTTLKENKIVHKQPDRVEMMNDKVWIIKNDEKTELINKFILADGSTVMHNGTVKAHNGSTKKMKNGDCIYMNGKWREPKKEAA